MLFIESERMANGLYPPDDCESERTVIISELHGGENDPDQFLDQEVVATAFKAHPYRHPTIGWLGDLEAMTRDDLYGYYKRYYVPNNASLVIVGDVDTDDALRRAEQHFGKIPAGALPPRQTTIEPEQTGERRVTIRKPGTAAYLKLAYHAPAIGDPRFYALLVLDAALTGAYGLNSGRLRRRRRSAARVSTGARRRTRLRRQRIAAADGLRSSTLSRPRRPTARRSGPSSTNSPLSSRKWRRTDHAGRAGEAKSQLNARLVFENDSVTNIAPDRLFGRSPASTSSPTSARIARSRSTTWPPLRVACSRNPTGPSAGSIPFPWTK
jgi:hypothetical protein